MESSTTAQEISTQQLKVRELSEEYLRIEENTEYLTHLQRYGTHRSKVLLRGDRLPDLKSLALLTVQISYLLFTCHVKAANILLRRHFLLLHPARNDPTPEVTGEYLLEKELLGLPEEEQRVIEQSFTRHEFTASQPRAYALYALYYVNSILSLSRTAIERAKLPLEKMLARHMAGVQAIVRNFLEPQINTLPHPRVFILALQESELFREHSALVKVMNNSIFAAIRNCRNKSVFAEICRLENILLAQRNPKHPLEANALEVELAIEELLKFLIRNHIITVEQSIHDPGKLDPNKPQSHPTTPPHATTHNSNATPNSPNNLKPYVLGEVQGSVPADRRYICKIQVPQKPIREFTVKVFDSVCREAANGNSGEEQQGEKNEKQLAKNEFLVQFMAGKGLLSVKYVTPIELNIQNTDLVMFQCNNIAYHWSSVSMELVEKSPSKPVKRKERFLALKTIAHLHITDRPLFKLLLMLDLVMLCAKVAEPELRRNIVRPEDYGRVEEISLKVEHLIKLFIRKVERYYKIIAEAETTKPS